MTRLSQLVRCKIPIIQAPMAGILTVQLAAEVTKAGAVGSLPFGGVDPRDLAKIEAMVSEFQRLTDGSSMVNLNFFCHDVYDPPSEAQKQSWFDTYDNLGHGALYDHSVIKFNNGNVSFRELERDALALCTFYEYVLQIKPAIILFHFGCPETATVVQFQKTSIVLATVNSVHEAFVACSRGIDGLVCQGWEAGGHRGTFVPKEDTHQLTEELYDAVRAQFPDKFVIPAGGIVTRDDVLRYLKKGADMVQMGLAFLLCPELLSAPYIRDGNIARTTKTRMVDFVSGKPARCIETPFITALGELSDKHRLQMPYGYMYDAYKTYKTTQDPLCGFYLAGSHWDQIELGVGAGQLVTQLGTSLPELPQLKEM